VENKMGIIFLASANTTYLNYLEAVSTDLKQAVVSEY
jgi:hypothetical protein